MKLSKFLFCCALYLACSVQVLAQVPSPADIDREQNRLQQQQQQLIERQMRERELREAEAGRPQARKAEQPSSSESAASDISAKPVPEAARCVEIREVEFSGNTILSDRRIRNTIAPYLGRCLTLADINELLNSITNVYIDKGYITSRALMAMPQEKLKEGILAIKIYEGKLSRIEGIRAAEQATAFPMMEEKILNLRDIEQGLEQINRLGSNRASMSVKADETRQGYSGIVIKNEPQGRTRAGITLDNLGSESTGKWRAGLRLAEDNTLGLNDQINIAYTNSLPDEWGDRQSKSAVLGFSAPFGWWTMFNNFSWSYYKTSFAMPISGDRFYSIGESVNESFAIERMLARGQSYKLAVNAGITYKDNKNYMRVYDLELLNEASSRSLSILNFDLPLTLYFNGGMIYLKPGMVRGIRAFGSFDDTDSPYSQKAQYGAYKLYMFSNWNFGYASLATAFDGQFSRDELFSTEAFYIGGDASVRGFKNDGTQGDSGFSVRSDLTFSLPRIFGSESRWLGAFAPGLFADLGRVFPNAQSRGPGTLAGVGAKLAFNYGIFDITASYARPIKKEDWMSETSAVYLSAGLGGRF